MLSAGWLHGGLLHIFMNMMAVRQLAPAIAELYGPGRMVIIYTVGGAAGFALSSFAGVPSRPFRFLRRTVHRRRVGVDRRPDRRDLAYSQRTGSTLARSYATQSPSCSCCHRLLLPGIDNYAHAGGFAGGYLAARLLDPLKPERIDHIVIAVLCLGAVARFAVGRGVSPCTACSNFS